MKKDDELETPRKKFGVTSQNIQAALKELGEEDCGVMEIDRYHKKTEEERKESTLFYDALQVQHIVLNAVKQLDKKVQELEQKLSEK